MEGFDMEKVQQELHSAVQYVVNDVKEKFRQLNQGPAILDSLRAFVAAVDWKSQLVHSIIFFGIMAVVYNAERLNGLAARNWRKFSKQNYFDSQGIFTSALLSGPLLLIMFAMLVNYLLATSRLLIQMKRKELLYRARQQQKAAAANKAGGEAKKEK
ncbi:hypothetical protein N2152v2_009341 [Parachlorella kessleri]